MIDAKFVKREADKVFYRLKDHKQLTAGLLKKLDWPADVKHVFFEFKPFAPKAGYLDPKVSKEHSVRVVYGGSRKDIKLPGNFKEKADMRLVSASSFPEFRKLAERAFARHYVRPIKTHLSKSFKKECDVFFDRKLKKCSNVLLTRNGRNVGLASTLDAGIKGKPGTLVAMIWIDETLPKAAREHGRLLLARWLRGHSKSRFAAIEHAKSRKTQVLFSSLGFKPMRFNVEKLNR